MLVRYLGHSNMSAGRRRGWWLRTQQWAEAVKQAEQEEDKDGRLKSEGRKRRVPSKGHAEGCDRTKI